MSSGNWWPFCPRFNMLSWGTDGDKDISMILMFWFLKIISKSMSINAYASLLWLGYAPAGADSYKDMKPRTSWIYLLSWIELMYNNLSMCCNTVIDIAINS